MLHRAILSRGAHTVTEVVIKPVEFYEKHAALREYFYHVDLVGRLFVEDMHPKIITTSLKDPKFLKFFFSQLKANTTGRHPEYPYMSPCGKEMNFILPADKPVVFDALSDDGTQLTYAGGALAVPFSPDSLLMSPALGHVYHPHPARSPGGYHGLGLLASRLAVQICANVTQTQVPTGSGGTASAWLLDYQGRQVVVHEVEE